MLKTLVFVCAGVPTVTLLTRRIALARHSLALGLGQVENALEDLREVVVGERESRATGDFAVLNGVEVQRQRTAGHGFDESGVGAADPVAWT